MKTKIFVGPAGIGNGESVLPKLHELGLTAGEVEFVRQTYMSNKTAAKVGEIARENSIRLSVHASYYVNLNSSDKKKISASKKRILDACERGHFLGATHIVFHPAYYGKDDPETVYQRVKESVSEMLSEIKKNKWNVKLAPETTGKKSAFGSLDETLRLVKETKCSCCIDFAHLLARNSKIDYNEVASKIKKLGHVHCHFSGIEYTEKGERRHILVKSWELKKLAEALKRKKITATIICESPDPVGDSLKIKKAFEKIGYI